MKSNQIKLKIILGSALGAIILILAIPFLINLESNLVLENFIQGGLSILIFSIVAYLWNEFNKLRIKMNKEELEDQDLTELEHDVEKLANSKVSNKNYKK